MKIKHSLLVVLLVVVSCTQDYTLDRETLQLVPYQGNETLIFKSSMHVLDTVFLLGTHRYSVSDNHFRIFPADTYETYILKCAAYDAYDQVYRGDQVMIELIQTSEGTNITFNIPIKEIRSFGYYPKTALERLQNTQLAIGNATYTDVKIIERDNTYQEEGYFAQKFYWSDTEGFLGVDHKNEQWRLVEKY